MRLPVIGDGLRDALEARSGWVTVGDALRDAPRARSGWVTGGGAVALVVATLLYTRFSLQGGLSRDESLYVYGGQQLVNHGTPSTPSRRARPSFPPWASRWPNSSAPASYRVRGSCS
jgi:hypothetical protein